MKHFLEGVAEIFAGRSDLANICFVFPNRRSSLFFQRYLGLVSGRTLFSPTLKTIKDLFLDMSDLEEVERIEALNLLYHIYVKLRNDSEPESFDDFICWGDILLSDFDDIDKYQVHTAELLRNVKDLKDLSINYDFLSVRQKEAIAQFCTSFNVADLETLPSGDKKRMFAETWDLLLPLYDEFRLLLASRGEGYEGMIYRKVAENIDLTPLKQKYSELVFVGLNALNKCEKDLLTAVKKDGFGDFYWDFYGGFVKDEANRPSVESSASSFIFDNVSLFPSKHTVTGMERNEEQEIEIIKVPSAVGQTRVACSIIERLEKAGEVADFVETAVVLPDENLLFPMLNAIPDRVGTVNVTMGYPLSASSVSSFFDIIERLQSNVRVKRGEMCFYHKDVVDMVEHPLFAAADSGNEGKRMKKEIAAGNIIFVPQSLFCDLSELFRLVFRVVENTSGIADYQSDIIQYIQIFQSRVDREFLAHYMDAVNKLKRLSNDRYGEEMALDFSSLKKKTYFRLLQQYVRLISIPYRGEPLEGLQIMGPLETRALDFRNVIMLSVGEGTFPSKSVSSSFIPYNLRIGFGLPTYEFQDTIWSYYFYRSIYRAKKIFLLYDSRTEGMQNGEESRYIKQLKYHYNVPLREETATYSIASDIRTPENPFIAKTPEVIAELKSLFVGGKGAFSATSLNTYIDCPMKFYYQFVKGFKEQEEVSEELDSRQFGDVYHKSMETLYKPFVGRMVNFSDIETVRKNKEAIIDVVEESFRGEVHINEIIGQNRLLCDLIIKYIDKTLQIDSQMTPFSLVGVERKISSVYLSNRAQGTVRLKGMIDRLDSNEPGVVRVVDYKTGSVEKKDNCKDVAKMFDNTVSQRPAIAFQLYFYSLILSENQSGGEAVKYVQSVYPLRTIFKDLPKMYEIEEDKLEQYKILLYELIDSVFDPDIPFESRPDEKRCLYCDFKKLCGR